MSLCVENEYMRFSSLSMIFASISASSLLPCLMSPTSSHISLLATTRFRFVRWSVVTHTLCTEHWMSIVEFVCLKDGPYYVRLCSLFRSSFVCVRPCVRVSVCATHTINEYMEEKQQKAKATFRRWCEQYMVGMEGATNNTANCPMKHDDEFQSVAIMRRTATHTNAANNYHQQMHHTMNSIEILMNCMQSNEWISIWFLSIFPIRRLD